METEHDLLVLERQMLRKIFGPIKSKEGWRIINNKELQKLIKVHIVNRLKPRGFFTYRQV
jgi:hypothetical protein